MPVLPACAGWRVLRPAGLMLAWLATGPVQAEAPPPMPTPTRQAQLLRMVQQDCGACHGLRLTGGLGPALTPAALVARGGEDMAYATIWFGRAGTPMPPWRGLLLDDEARWLARQLVAGQVVPEARP